MRAVPTNCPTTGVPDEALQRKEPCVWERGSEVHLSIPCLKPGSIAGWGEGLGWAGRGAHHPAHPVNVSKADVVPAAMRAIATQGNPGRGTGASDLYAPVLLARTSKEIVSAQDVAHGKLRF